MPHPITARLLAPIALGAALALAACGRDDAETNVVADPLENDMMMDMGNDASAMESLGEDPMNDLPPPPEMPPPPPPPVNDVLGNTSGGDTGGNVVESNVSGM
jgi:hypothetical protein